MSDSFLDIASFGRRGPGRRDQVPPALIEQIARTVRRAPEAVVKVLPKGATDAKAVRAHLDYIGRRGELELETDDGDRLQGKEIGKQLADDWDLDIAEERRQANLFASRDRTPPKIAHKLTFSMPPGTSPTGVLEAVRNFTREEFGLKHRYVLVLHTDEPHPHVHVVVKAMGEHGQRLNIRKATLREWRSKFASDLRKQGIDANATPRYLRGKTKLGKSDAIYRAALRGQSRHMLERAERVAAELRTGKLQVEPGRSKIVQTRKDVEAGWRAVADILLSEGHSELATEIRRFADQMRAPKTEKELMVEVMLAASKEPSRQVRAERVR
jgi:hypothetical protein